MPPVPQQPRQQRAQAADGGRAAGDLTAQRGRMRAFVPAPADQRSAVPVGWMAAAGAEKSSARVREHGFNQASGAAINQASSMLLTDPLASGCPGCGSAAPPAGWRWWPQAMLPPVQPGGGAAAWLVALRRQGWVQAATRSDGGGAGSNQVERRQRRRRQHGRLVGAGRGRLDLRTVLLRVAGADCPSARGAQADGRLAVRQLRPATDPGRL